MDREIRDTYCNTLESVLTIFRYVCERNSYSAELSSRLVFWNAEIFHSETACERISSLQSDMIVLLHISLHSNPEHFYMSSAYYGAEFETLTALTGSEYNEIDFGGGVGGDTLQTDEQSEPSTVEIQVVVEPQTVPVVPTVVEKRKLSPEDVFAKHSWRKGLALWYTVYFVTAE